MDFNPKKLEFSKITNVLELSNYRYELQERKEPNLYRELFDYDSVPKVPFNHRLTPMFTPDDLWITDTTFRDGQQSMTPFTVEQIVHLYKLLNRLGGPNGMIHNSEFFVYTENDRAAVEKCLALGYQFPEVTGWIRANEKDFELVKSIGLKETGILVSCSDYHIYKKMKITRAQAMDKYLGVIKTALSNGIIPRCHFEDITRADFYGFVLPLATNLMDLSEEAGIPIKIRACDTLGYGVNYPGVALPRSVAGIVYGLHHYAHVPSAWLEWHGHNDFYKVVSNSATAWLYGASAVNCAIMGIGERTGNCPLEAMVIEYASLRGNTNGMDLPVITEIAEYCTDVMGFDIPQRTPFVGSNFNTTRAGIHADGLLKDEEIYNIFDTRTLLNRPPRVTVDAHSGLAGVAHWINTYFLLSGEHLVDKQTPVVIAIKAMVDDEFSKGRNTTLSDGELKLMFKKADLALYKEFMTQYKHV